MIIRGGTTLVTENERAECRKLDVRIEHARITAVQSGIVPREGEEIIDASGKLILPGLVNAHYHSYGNLLKGTAWGEPLEVWTPDTVALGSRMDANRMRLATQLGIAEMLHNGVTCCLDHIPHLDHVDTIAQTYKNSGFRAVIAPMIADRSDEKILPGISQALQQSDCPRQTTSFREMGTVLRLYDDWVELWHRPKETLQVVTGINSPQRASKDALETARKISRRHHLKVHAHLLETSWQAQAAKECGEDPLEKLDKAGLLNVDLSLAHCVWLTASQKDRLQNAGCTVVHNPTSNLLLGSGRIDLVALLRCGINVAVGSDGSNCATGQNMLQVVRTAILLSRLDREDYWNWLTQKEALSLVTTNGAAVCGWAGETGAITPGMFADVVLMDERTNALLPQYDTVTQLLLLQDSIRATDVFIHGRRIMQDNKILCFNEEAIYQELIDQQQERKSEFSTTLHNHSAYKRIVSNAYRDRISDIHASRKEDWS